MLRFFCLVFTCFYISAAAALEVRDAAGDALRLPGPARRIVSLAPHVTENLYAAGAGQRLVGAVLYSDFPPAARALPQVGGYDSPDLEAILALKPDLVVGWLSGNPPALLEKLRTLGIPVYVSELKRLDDIAAEIERFGRLAGTETAARREAAGFRQRLVKLRARHAGLPAVRVFYQVWNRPLLTVGRGQIIGEAIRLCGGESVFASLSGLAPVVSVEAVLAADPEAVVASGMGADTPVGLEDWRRWHGLTAVARGNLFFVPADLMQRPTPRLLEGTGLLCGHLAQARARRP